MRIAGILCLSLAVLVIFASCFSSPKSYARIDDLVNKGSYDKALALIDAQKGKASEKNYTSRSKILFYLDRGMLNYYAGNYAESSEDLQTAERLIEEAFTKSISQEISTFLLNDNMRDYPGEDYEDLYINVFGALNYYHAGKTESSIVEVRRLNEKLVYLADRYERAKKKVVSSNGQVNDIPMEASKFSNSALARYLGMLFYRGTGRHDSARIDCDELRRAYQLAPGIYANPIPSSVSEELSVPRDKGRLNVIAFSGLSPVKKAENIIIPLPLPVPNNIARLSLPMMAERPSAVQKVEVVLDSGENFELELLENMGGVAKETFKSKRALIILKTAARVIAKSAASAAAAEVTKKKQGELAGFLVGADGKIVSEISEQADIRHGRYFPCRALVGGINLEPGTYTVTINYYGSNEKILYSQAQEINVRQDVLNLCQSFYLN